MFCIEMFCIELFCFSMPLARGVVFGRGAAGGVPDFVSYDMLSTSTPGVPLGVGVGVLAGVLAVNGVWPAVEFRSSSSACEST